MDLKKELREVLAWIKAFRALDAGEERDAKKGEVKEKIARAKELDEAIRQDEELAAIEERNNETINGDRGTPSGAGEGRGSGVTVEDQPIYRSRFPLGEQCHDMITVAKRGNGSNEARER
jgi:hypothetical protein